MSPLNVIYFPILSVVLAIRSVIRRLRLSYLVISGAGKQICDHQPPLITIPYDLSKKLLSTVHFPPFFHNILIEGFFCPTPHLDSRIHHSQTVEQLRSDYQNEKSVGASRQIP